MDLQEFSMNEEDLWHKELVNIPESGGWCGTFQDWNVLYIEAEFGF